MKRRRRRYGKAHKELLKRARPLYNSILRKQGGGCAICGRPPSERRRLDIDHDHQLIVVRGLLCHRCNRALPQWMDSAWLRKAAAYLEQPPYELKDFPVGEPEQSTLDVAGEKETSG